MAEESRPTNPYEVLGVPRSASLMRVQEAYACSVDEIRARLGDQPAALRAATFELNEAYAVLANPLKRQAHDRASGFEPKRLPPPVERDWDAARRETFRRDGERRSGAPWLWGCFGLFALLSLVALAAVFGWVSWLRGAQGDAEHAVGAFHDHYRDGTFGEIYVAAHPDLRRDVTQQDAVAVLSDLRRTMGGLRNTQELCFEAFKSVGGGRESMHIEYRTRFASGEAIETFDWVVVGGKPLLLTYGVARVTAEQTYSWMVVLAPRPAAPTLGRC